VSNLWGIDKSSTFSQPQLTLSELIHSRVYRAEVERRQFRLDERHQPVFYIILNTPGFFHTKTPSQTSQSTTPPMLPRIKICGNEIFSLMFLPLIILGSSDDRNPPH
jgi:hypothetical protein